MAGTRPAAEPLTPQAAVLPVDWGQFAASIPGASDWSTLSHLVP